MEQIFNFAKDTFKDVSTKTSVRLHRALASYMNSIGQISCGSVRATCWLVADMLVITDYHVYIMFMAERESHQNFNLPIRVSFDCFFRERTEGVFTVEVDEERDPHIESSHLDYKFLRLKENESLRNRVPLGKIVRNRVVQEGLVVIVGYPEREEMHEETCAVVSRHSLPEKLKQRHATCTGVQIANAELLLSIEKYQCYLAYDTSLFRGFGGSPVFDMNGNIVAMHTKGYMLNVEGKTYSLMEFGVEFGAICEDMRCRYNVVEDLFPNCQLGFDEELVELQADPLRYYVEVTTKHKLEIQQKEGEKAFDRLFHSDDDETLLKGLEWVESFKIVDENEECDARHLEIVCKLGKVPHTADIVKYFGEEILPFITYQECPKREWFEANILDENYDMKKEHKDSLRGLSWVADFYVGVAREPEKSWQIYITYAQNNAPSMKELKKLFGVNIAYFVEFIQGGEVSTKSSFLRGPRSGDKLCVQHQNGTIGIIIAADGKHYATTCYHVCFEDDVPKGLELAELHESLKTHYAKGHSASCESMCSYNTGQGDLPLGTFHRGLYNDHYDIALIELENYLNCDAAVEFLNTNSITPNLADKRKVIDKLYDASGELDVEKYGSVSGKTKGVLYGFTGDTPPGSKIEDSYRIKGKHNMLFAKKGDSGSLVCMVVEDERIPFCYLSNGSPDGKVAYCLSLSDSLNELLKERQHRPCFSHCVLNHQSQN